MRDASDMPHAVRRWILVTLVLALLPSLGSAGVIRGRVQYTKFPAFPGGLGTSFNQAVRFATVQIRSNALPSPATGLTDINGNYSIAIPDVFASSRLVRAPSSPVTGSR